MGCQSLLILLLRGYGRISDLPEFDPSGAQNQNYISDISYRNPKL